MFSLNTQGQQRKLTLENWKTKLKTKFGQNLLYTKALQRAQKQILNLNQTLKGLNLDFYFHPAYFSGLVVGDGCFGCDFDLRQKRKATLVQSLSLSLIKTQRNELLLDFLAQNLSFVWVKRPSLNGQYSVRVQKQSKLKKLGSLVFKPSFRSNAL